MALPDLVCFSHLRWDFVWQRPQHLMTRAAASRQVWFVEEPVGGDEPRLDVRGVERGVQVVRPMVPDGSPEERAELLRTLIGRLLATLTGPRPTCWYSTPMALSCSAELEAGVVIYDCMDELTAFVGAPRDLPRLEQELFDRADLVFTGGASLYEAKCRRHGAVHLFPSSVDTAHFRRARADLAEPPDQIAIGRPRLGYCGVLDERLDTALVRGVAARRPEWQFVMLGPVVKIDPATLPRGGNLHYLGMKPYELLPAYLSGWDVALLPFARNEATRFISPTKTPEYLAAGRPVVSTSIRDVVCPYGERGLAAIADTSEDFIAAVEERLVSSRAMLAARADLFLEGLSWDSTWQRMNALIEDAERRQSGQTARARATPARERSIAGSVA